MRVAIGAALAVLMGAFAGAQTAVPGQDEMNVVDQPGYQPTPEEEQLTGAYEKQEVFFRTTEAPGTIIIDTQNRFLYLVQGNNRALRYGIGVGRDGFQWSGLKKISRKQEWPDWRPPPEMIERQPYLPRFMAGGPGQSARREGDVSGHDRLSDPRHQPATDDWPCDLVGLLPPGQ